MDSILKEYLGSAQLSASLIIPVIVVIISGVLVFICGFRKPKEPQFRKIAASVEASTKKTKRKEKPQTPSTKSSVQNGAVKTAKPAASAAETKKQTPAATKKESQPQQQAAAKKKETTQKKQQPSQKPAAPAKKEKTPKPEKVKKPADFDDGGWTTVPSRTDKKKNKEDALLSQALDSALAQTGKKADAKSSKNPKQLKDQVNKSKKEAADNKNKKKTASTEDTEQVNNKVVDTIENLVNELKKKDSSGELITSAPSKKKQDIDSLIDSTAAEKSDDSKPVPEGGVVFNEMEDTWTEAKAPKKGKKKARKD